MTQPETTISTTDIVARAGTYYRNTRYLISALLVGFGLWSCYDGFVKWPKDNQKHAEIGVQMSAAARNGASAEQAKLAEEQAKYKPHTDLDIMLNRAFGVLFPPLGIIMLFYALNSSRGEIRLTPADILHAPGHPPVPLDNLTELDRKLWDRKGIAFVNYQLADAKTGQIKLDDFVYERKPIDAIYERILAKFPEVEPAVSDNTDASV